MTTRAFSRLLPLSALLTLVLAGLAPACRHAPNQNNTTGAPSVMYQLQSIQTTWRLSPESDPDAGEAWELVPPPESLEGCFPEEDPCTCAGIFRATAAIVFIPERRLKIHWLRQTGVGGHYGDGVLVESEDGFRYEGPTPAPSTECAVTRMVWNDFRRLLAVEMLCNWESEDGTCRGEDRVSVVFPSDDPLLPPPVEELPWGEEVEGETFRFGDDPTSIPVPGLSN